jgi:hypothetical protein
MLIALIGSVQSPRPGFRRDLVVQPRVKGTSRFFVVSDPRTQRTLRFTLEGYAVAKLLDGQRSLPQLVGVIRKKLGLQMTVDKLHRLIDRLDALGCLTTSDLTSDRAVTTVLMKRPRRLTSSIERFELPPLPTITPATPVQRLGRAASFLELSTGTEFPGRGQQDDSARAILFASFALVLAALWATWAVLRIM